MWCGCAVGWGAGAGGGAVKRKAPKGGKGAPAGGGSDSDSAGEGGEADEGGATGALYAFPYQFAAARTLSSPRQIKLLHKHAGNGAPSPAHAAGGHAGHAHAVH